MNNGSWLSEEEEELKGLSDNFFDDIINDEDMETANDDEGDWDAKFVNLVPPPLDVLTSLSSEFSHGKALQRGGRVQRKPVPTLKQSSSSEVSSTIDSSLPDTKVSPLFQSPSAVSLLDNSSISFPKGTRSNLRKRPSPPTISSLKSFASQMVQQFAPDDPHSETNHLPSSKKPRQKRNNASFSDTPESFNADGTIRMCSHCETTKTPQWREGPCGPKTLCNACGVRFRSGRLVPEYRPSSSPSFIPSVHSNSHRKIIEMRRKDNPG